MSRLMCTVCRERKTRSVMFCAQCARSYDNAKRASSGDIASVIEWAADRSRWFERRRLLTRAVAKLEAVEKEVRRG